MITVEFLGIFQDFMDCRRWDIEPELVTDVFSLVKLLCREYIRFEQYLNNCSNGSQKASAIYNGITIMINGYICKTDHVIRDGDKIVITIPMSGG